MTECSSLTLNELNIWHSDRDGNYSHTGQKVRTLAFPHPKTSYNKGDTIGYASNKTQYFFFLSFFFTFSLCRAWCAYL